MMYYLDSKWRRQALVYFGEPQDLMSRECRGRCLPGRILNTTTMVCSGTLLLKYLVARAPND